MLRPRWSNALAFERIHYLCLALIVFAAPAFAEQSPANMLATRYLSGVEVHEYLVSEKLDGVRARWDGRKLISRGGRTFAAPSWFTQGFPKQPLDGELWSKRGDYQNIASITAKRTPHIGWQQLRFMVFDLPNSKANFAQRYALLQQIVGSSTAHHLGLVQQSVVQDEATLLRQLNEVVLAGAEGLMLHHRESTYKSGRSQQLLKLKQFQDAEAVVIGYRPGKGKYMGMTGALQVRRGDGVEFYVGSGLHDADRQQPPALGTVIRYRYSGFTDSGLPRFPVYLGTRPAFDR